MPDSPTSRIISLSSVAHKSAQINFDDLSCGKDGGVAYGQSKLACLMFSDELHRRLTAANHNVLALAVHPGGSDSGLFEEMNRAQYFLLRVLSPFITHSNSSAAKPSLQAALGADIVGGKYMGPTGFKELRGPVGNANRSDYSKNQKAASRLWAMSEELTDQVFMA